MSRLVAAFVVLAAFSAPARSQLLVADRATHQISTFDPATGNYLGVLVPGDPAANGGMLFPSAMAKGPHDELLVASQIGTVFRYDLASGDYLGTFATGLNVPSGLLYREASDELFVSTLGNFDSELVLRYRASTGELLSTLGEGTGPSGRSSIVQGPDGNLYVSAFATDAFFSGAVLQFDGETLTPAPAPFAQLPGLAGASGLTFRPGPTTGTYQLDVVGLFSNTVARFDVAETEMGLALSDANLIITDLDFPSAITDLDANTLLVTSLGNDNPDTGALRPGSIDRFDIATGQRLGTFIPAGGDANLAQPSALLLLPTMVDCVPAGSIAGDLNGDGKVAFADFTILSANYGKSGAYHEGDIDCDGQVGFGDFTVLSANYGRSSGGVAAVPEPSGLTSFVVAIMICLVRHRVRKKN